MKFLIFFGAAAQLLRSAVGQLPSFSRVDMVHAINMDHFPNVWWSEPEKEFSVFRAIASDLTSQGLYKPVDSSSKFRVGVVTFRKKDDVSTWQEATPDACYSPEIPLSSGTIGLYNSWTQSGMWNVDNITKKCYDDAPVSHALLNTINDAFIGFPSADEAAKSDYLGLIVITTGTSSGSDKNCPYLTSRIDDFSIFWKCSAQAPAVEDVLRRLVSRNLKLVVISTDGGDMWKSQMQTACTPENCLWLSTDINDGSNRPFSQAVINWLSSVALLENGISMSISGILSG